MKENPRYICFHCGGKGEVESHGPTWESIESCRHCHGSGKFLIEIPLSEYEELKKALKLACELLAANCPAEVEAELSPNICMECDCDNDTAKCWEKVLIQKARENLE